jgi:hypothetical protein
MIPKNGISAMNDMNENAEITLIFINSTPSPLLAPA